MVEGGTSGTSDDGGVDVDWDFHENVSGDSGSGSNGEWGEHSAPRGERGLIRYGEADSEDALGSDEEEGEGDEGEKYTSGREGAYDQKHRANDADKGFEVKGRGKEHEAETRNRKEKKGNWKAGPEEDEEDDDEDYDEEEDDGEDEDNDGKEETNGDDDYDYVEDDLEDDEHQQQQQTHQAKEERRVSREEGVGGTRGNRTESASEDDDDGGNESEDFKLHTYRPTPGQDIYGRPVDKGNAGTVPAKYVPPHLRASTGGSEVADSDKRQQVQVRVSGKSH